MAMMYDVVDVPCDQKSEISIAFINHRSAARRVLQKTRNRKLRVQQIQDRLDDINRKKLIHRFYASLVSFEYYAYTVQLKPTFFSTRLLIVFGLISLSPGVAKQRVTARTYDVYRSTREA